MVYHTHRPKVPGTGKDLYQRGEKMIGMVAGGNVQFLVSILLNRDKKDGRAEISGTEREKDGHEPPSGPADTNSQSKRIRINRNRYPSQPSPSTGNNPHGFARKVLPIDPSAGDRNRGRQD